MFFACSLVQRYQKCNLNAYVKLNVLLFSSNPFVHWHCNLTSKTDIQINLCISGFSAYTKPNWNRTENKVKLAWCTGNRWMHSNLNQNTVVRVLPSSYFTNNVKHFIWLLGQVLVTQLCKFTVKWHSNQIEINNAWYI